MNLGDAENVSVFKSSKKNSGQFCHFFVFIDDDSGKRSFIINRRIKTTIRKDILW